MGFSLSDLNPFHGDREKDWLGDDVGEFVNDYVTEPLGNMQRGGLNIATGGLYNVARGGSWEDGLKESFKDIADTPGIRMTRDLVDALGPPELEFGDAQKLQAELARSQWERYKDAFIPLEDQLISTVYNPTYRRQQAMQSYTEAQPDTGRFQDAVQRRRAGFGLTMTEPALDEAARGRDISDAKSRISAYNNALRLAEDRETKVLGGGLTGMPQLDMRGNQ